MRNVLRPNRIITINPNFISSPRGKSKSGYGGFVYLIFVIGGVAPKWSFTPKMTDDYD
jgi:hypothetical protein